MSPTTTREPSYIDPSRLYSRRGFIADAGVSETKIREAKRHGLELPWLVCGKRKFVRGSDAIAFIERLAAMQ